MVRNVVLVKPEVRYPVKKQGYSGDVGIPLGLLYLGGYVRDRNGANVSIVDYRLNKALGVPRDFARDFGNADVVGVGACTAEAPDAMQVMREAKAMGKITVMGGLYPTSNANEVLRSGVVDYVVFGEGEEGLAKILQVVDGRLSRQDLRGVAFQENGNIVVTQGKELIADLNSIPQPAYDLVPVDKYAKMSPAGVYAARGCPMACKHCTLNEHWEYRYRKRSFDNILEELGMLQGFGFERVHFKDETITLDKKWCGALFKEIEGARLGMSYKAKSRIDGVEEGLIRQMVSAGVDTIHTGVESVSQVMLDKMQKQVRGSTVRSAFDILLGNRCRVNPVYMFGYPGETPETLAENAAFIEEMGVRDGVITYISFITPHPGSGFEKDMPGDLRVLSTDHNRYTHKQPVAVPASLGRGGVRLMVDHYNHIADVCGMQDVNPRVDEEYLAEIMGKDERDEVHIIHSATQRAPRRNGKLATLTVNQTSPERRLITHGD